MSSRIGTIEKYWKAIPNVQASTKSARNIPMSELADSEAKSGTDQAVR
jgi:hypothetical protein